MYPQIPNLSLPTPSSPNAFAAILLLPLVPLLLFFIGARALPSSPDGGLGLGGSDSPFSLGEVYTTAAFVSVAGVTVLMLAAWPDMGRQVGGWVGYRHETAGVGMPEVQGNGYAMKFERRGRRAGEATEAASRMRQAGRGKHGQRHSQEEVEGKGGAKGLRMVQQGPAGRQEQVIVDDGSGAADVFVEETVTAMPIPKTQAGRAHLRTQLIRAQFPRAYSPYRPHTFTAILLCGLFVAAVVVASQKIMTQVYAIEASSSSTSSSNRSRTSGSSKDKDKDKDRQRKKDKDDRDAAKMTPWVMAEIKHRQAEKDDESATLSRVAKDAEKERTKLKGVQEKVGKKEFDEYRRDKAKERSAEIDLLRKQLIKLGLPLVGIPEKKDEPADEVADDKGSGEDGADTGKFGKLKDTVSNWFDLDPTKKKEKEKEKEKKADKPKEPSVPVKDKVKQFLFLDAYDDDAATHNKAKAEVEAYKEQVKAQTIADLEAKDAEIEAARKINASAANAEALARKMKAG